MKEKWNCHCRIQTKFSNCVLMQKLFETVKNQASQLIFSRKLTFLYIRIGSIFNLHFTKIAEITENLKFLRMKLTDKSTLTR